jgi:hypothetical protein
VFSGSGCRLWNPTLVRWYLAARNDHTRVVCITDNVIPHSAPGDRPLTRYFLGLLVKRWWQAVACSRQLPSASALRQLRSHK